MSPSIEPEWRWCAADYASWDFERADGMKVELKQSAARQSWISSCPPRPTFDIRQRKGRWEGSRWIDGVGRNADLYIFAWHGIADESTDHRDPAQWTFHVVAEQALPPTQRISLASIGRLAQPCGFEELAGVVDAAVAKVGKGRAPASAPPSG